MTPTVRQGSVRGSSNFRTAMGRASPSYSTASLVTSLRPGCCVGRAAGPCHSALAGQRHQSSQDVLAQVKELSQTVPGPPPELKQSMHSCACVPFIVQALNCTQQFAE